MRGIFYNDFENSYIPEILTEIYRDKIYEPFLRGRKDLSILDVGANIGLTTQYFAQFARKIVAVEPSKQHVEVLRKMVEFNGLSDIVTVIDKALGTTNGDMSLYHNPNVTMFSLKKEVKSPEAGSETVEVVNMEKLLNLSRLQHIDFMKLDIEGAEMEVIGGEWFEMACERIDAMVVEYHSWTATNPSQLFNALSDYGYKVEVIPSSATLFGAVKK